MLLYLSSMHSRMLDLTTTTAHITYCPPDWKWDNTGKAGDEVNLWLVTQGSGTMTIKGVTQVLGPGSCFFIRMGDPCEGRHDPAQPLTVMWSLCRLRQGWPDARDQPRGYRQIANLPFVSQLYALAIRTHNDPRATRLEADLLMRALFLAVEEEDRLADRPGDTRLPQVQAIAERIRTAPGRSYPLPLLARECACSPGHFTRLFKHATGMPPRAFITHSRIVAARSLLRGSNHKIAHIADELGYADIFHFSRQFKEQTNQSPSEYRA